MDQAAGGLPSTWAPRLWRPLLAIPAGGGGDRPRRQRLRPVGQPDIPEDQGGRQDGGAWAAVSVPTRPGVGMAQDLSAAGADDRRPLGQPHHAGPGTPRPRPTAGEPWPSTTGEPAGGQGHRNVPETRGRELYRSNRIIVAAVQAPHKWAIGHTFEFSFSLPEPANSGNCSKTKKKPPRTTATEKHRQHAPRRDSAKYAKLKLHTKPDPASVETKSKNVLSMNGEETRHRSARSGARLLAQAR